MPEWKNVKVRGDLHRMVARRAQEDRRSISQMTDVLLTRALQQPEVDLSEVKAEIDLSEKIKNLEPSEGFKWNGRGRETFPKPIEGQATVDEMLASCPQCAGELRDVVAGVVDGQTVTAQGCVDCGWVREPA
jgi:hypothetical protein